ncbi:MAG TPA: TspO/MBR family protein [Anaeromyxobacteraceae bacterium]|nr:TspO/MBR family protein [Anaeromyxobacteraceae bacterium]
MLGSGSRAAARRPWYRLLRKPPWQPPPQVFGPVWGALYVAIGISGYRVWRSRSPARRRALALWGAQLALNAAWTPLFFGRRRTRAALVDLSLLVPAVAAYAITARRADALAGALMIPYLGWTGFAWTLNAAIVSRNRRTLARR